MTIDDKIVKDMEETRDRTIEIIAIMQIVLFLESIGSSIVGCGTFLIAYFVFHYSIPQLITLAEIFIVSVIAIMGLTCLIAILKQRMMFNEVDKRRLNGDVNHE